MDKAVPKYWKEKLILFLRSLGAVNCILEHAMDMKVYW